MLDVSALVECSGEKSDYRHNAESEREQSVHYRASYGIIISVGFTYHSADHHLYSALRNIYSRAKSSLSLQNSPVQLINAFCGVFFSFDSLCRIDKRGYLIDIDIFRDAVLPFVVCGIYRAYRRLIFAVIGYFG